MKNNRKNGFSSLWVVVVIVILLIGGFFGYQYLKLQKIRGGIKPPTAERAVLPLASTAT